MWITFERWWLFTAYFPQLSWLERDCQDQTRAARLAHQRSNHWATRSKAISWARIYYQSIVCLCYQLLWSLIWDSHLRVWQRIWCHNCIMCEDVIPALLHLWRRLSIFWVSVLDSVAIDMSVIMSKMVLSFSSFFFPPTPNDFMLVVLNKV